MASILTEKSRRPQALTIDDDPDFNKMMKLLLGRLGLDVTTTSTPEEFLKKLKDLRPDLCIIDLNIGELNSGYTIIKAVRSVLGADLPLLVCSRFSDRQSIAHALEIGANDFIVKPVDQDLLATKLARYVSSDEIEDAVMPMKGVPPEGEKAYLTLDVEITEIDELGLKIQTPHLVTKGTALYMDHQFIHILTGKGHPVLMTVASTWVEPDGKNCGAYIEFDENDDELRASVRRWLAANAPGKDV